MDAYADGTPLPNDNTASWYAFAQQPYEQGGLGLAPHQAAGLVGNLLQESGSGIPSWGPSGDNRTAWGAAQWREDRLDGLKSFAKANGMDPKSTEAQQAWMRQELSTTHSNAYDAIRNANTPEDAANAFNKLYEISADRSGQRAANARALFEGGPAAIAKAAGIPAAGGRGALAYAGEDDSEDDTPATSGANPALSPDNVMGKGALQTIMKPQQTNTMSTIGSTMAGMGAALAGISNASQGQALAAQAKQIADGGQSDFKYMMGADGTLYRMDDQGGIQSLKTGSAKGRQYQFMKLKDGNGNEVIHALDARTGQDLTAQQQGNTAPQAIGGDPNLQGMDRYNSMTPDEKRMIDAWHEGTGVNPTSLSQRNPRILKLMDAAQAVYPDMDFSKYGERSNFIKGYVNKSPLAFGGQIIGTDHTAALVGQMADSMLALKNSSAGGYAWPAHAVNMVKDATGGIPRSEITKGLKKQADTLSAEYQTLMTRGRGGGQGERETYSNDLNQPDAAPELQAAPLQKMLDAMKARHQEYVDAAKSGAGQSWLDKHPDVEKNVLDTFEKVQAKLDALHGLNSGGKSTAPTAPAINHDAIDAELKRRGLL